MPARNASKGRWLRPSSWATVCSGFIAEFFREPDAYLLWLQQQTGMSMGQWLCVPMIVGGVALWVWAQRRPQISR